MREQWLPIPGTGGLYDASDLGRIRSWKAYRGNPGPRILAPMRKSALGHQMVYLYLGGKRRPTLIHRAVLSAFVGPQPELQGRHLDGEPTNNRLENLAWGTQSDNELDKVRHGRHRNANKTHCVNGHEFTPENTRVTPKQRVCRTCQRASSRRCEARRRAA